MRFRFIFAVFCLAGVRLSTARENQTDEIRDESSLLIQRFNNLEEALREKDNEIIELREKVETVRSENEDLQEKIGQVKDTPFGYFCSYQDIFGSPDSVITYDKLLYSSQFGLQGDSPGIDINTGKFVAGFSGTWRVDFSFQTWPHEMQRICIYLYKNEEQMTETMTYSFNGNRGIDVNTGGRSVLLHLDLGDELHLGTTLMEDYAESVNFCVSLEQS